VKSGLLLDVVVRESTPILELLSSKDQTLLIRGNSFLVLDLGLDVLNSVSGLDIKSDSLSGQSLDENLHSTAKTEDEVESGLLLDVVVRESTPILELLASKDQTLLIRRNSFLVLDLGLDVLNSISGLDIKSDSLSGQSLDENLQSCVERVENSTKAT
jgi:hypothetical protein